MDALFTLINILVMPFWLLMIIAPTWSWTRRIMQSPWIAAPFAILYTLMVLPKIGPLFGELINPQLDRFVLLLGTPGGTLLSWVHFLTFDLLIGRWAYLESRERNYSPWIIGPVLFLILMVGPLGFLAYLFLRTFIKDTAEI